ncbi:hypothetical protein, partial [Burkholderia vietnamiensis]
MNGTNKVGGLISQLHQRWCDPAMFVLLVVQCIAVFGMIPAAASSRLLKSASFRRSGHCLKGFRMRLAAE